MKRSLLAALLLAAGALNAPAQRISLQVPLSPVPTLGGAAAVSLSESPFPLALSQFTPSLSAASIQVPFGSVPVPTARPNIAVAGPKTLLHPIRAAAAKPDTHQTVKIIDALSEHGALSAKLSELGGENGKSTHVKGIGMGLSIVKSIVDAHGGSIEVAAGNGGGACFRLTFPALAPQPAPLESRAEVTT